MRELVVIDADAVIRSMEADEFDVLERRCEFHAPRLMWTETSSVLHRLMRRLRSDGEVETRLMDQIIDSPIRLADAYDRRAPWDIASLLGWHKTYDAEYLAAAHHLGASIFTFDARLRQGARRFGISVFMP